MQKKATKIVPALKNLSYSERLKTCQMTTLHYRRIRGDMIETYKIVTGQYEAYVAPSLSRERTYVTRGNDLRLKSPVLNTTYENTVFLSEWSIYGIVCLTGLSLLTPLTYLKRDWINFGIINREPEVGVKFCMINFSKLVYCKVFL